jgi:hypothetical protein
MSGQQPAGTVVKLPPGSIIGVTAPVIAKGPPRVIEGLVEVPPDKIEHEPAPDGWTMVEWRESQSHRPPHHFPVPTAALKNGTVENILTFHQGPLVATVEWNGQQFQVPRKALKEMT